MCNVKYSVIRLVSAFPVCTYSNSHDVDPTVKWQPHQVTVYLWREHVAPGNPHLERISFHLVHKKLFHATICSTTTCKNNCLTNKLVWLFHQVEKLFYNSSKKIFPCCCKCCRVSICTILGKICEDQKVAYVVLRSRRLEQASFCGCISVCTLKGHVHMHQA